MKTLTERLGLGGQYRSYKLGDPVLIHTGEDDPIEGRVVHIFMLPGWDIEHYVIEFETAMDPVFEVRSGHVLQMQPSAGSQEFDSWVLEKA